MDFCHGRLTVFKYISLAVRHKSAAQVIFISSPSVAYTVVEVAKNLLIFENSSLVEYDALLIGKYHSY